QWRCAATHPISPSHTARTCIRPCGCHQRRHCTIDLMKTAYAILRTCRKTMGPNSLLLACEPILEPDPAIGGFISYMRDIHMMAMFCRVQERTEAEFRSLFDQSGLSLRRVIPTASPISIIEAASTR